jgi:L-alanine-DL-glutamate epimerase-like enolase superfamily enzyme
VIEEIYESCREIKIGVDGIGEWSIDFHTRFNRANAVRLANLIEDLDPFFAEDLIRSENQELYMLIRQQTNIPLALGEQFGVRWDFNRLVENDLMDYARVTLPNTAGITEFKKIMAMCETHYVGMIPHFTGPVATAALTHCLAPFTGIAMMEILGARPVQVDYLNTDYLDFREGKLYPVDKPGIGVEFLPDKTEKVLEVTEPASGAPPVFRRPDGSYTNW